MESYSEWRVLLEEGLANRRRKEANWYKWRMAYYNAGITNETLRDQEQIVKVYLGRTLINIMLPLLYFKDPYVVVSPLIYDNDAAEDSAASMEAWINYYLSSPGIMQSERNIRKAILDAMVVNEGYVESKWRYTTEEIPAKDDVDRLTFEYVTEDSPYILRVSPYDICEDPYSLDGLDGARWVARRKWFTIDAIRNNKGFSPSVRKQFSEPTRVSNVKRTLQLITNFGLEALRNRGIKGGAGIASTLDERFDGLAQVWYVYDLKYQRFVVFSPDVEGFLVDDENPYAHLSKFAIKKLSFEFDTDVEQPKSMMEMVLTQQREVNHIATREHEALKRFARIVEIPKGELVDGEVGENTLTNATDGTYIYVNQGGRIREIPWDTKEVNAILNGMKGNCINDAQFHFGIPASQTGVGHSKFKSATEVAQIAEAFDIRVDDLREQVSQWYEGVVTDLGDNIQVFLDDSKKFMIAGEVKNVGPEQIMGPRFKYQASLSEGMPETQKKRLERCSELYKMTQQEPLLDRSKVLVDLLKAMGIHRPNFYLAGGPPGSEAEIPGNIPVAGGSPSVSPTGIGQNPMAFAPPGMEAMITGGGMQPPMGGGGLDPAVLAQLMGGMGGM